MRNSFSFLHQRQLILTMGILALIFHSAVAQSSDPLNIDRYGNVGIGTSTPAARLEVVGPVKFSGTENTLIVDGPVGIGTTHLEAGAKMALKQDNTTWSIYPGYKNDSPQDNWTTLDMPGSANLRVRDGLSVEGAVSNDALRGSGSRPVYATEGGELFVPKPTTVFANKPGQCKMPENHNRIGFRPVDDVITKGLPLERGDVVLISVSFKFKWDSGSGADEPKFGIYVNGENQPQNEYLDMIDDLHGNIRNQFITVSFQMIYEAQQSGSHTFQLGVDNNTKANDPSTTADHVLVATKMYTVR